MIDKERAICVYANNNNEVCWRELKTKDCLNNFDQFKFLFLRQIATLFNRPCILVLKDNISTDLCCSIYVFSESRKEICLFDLSDFSSFPTGKI